MAADNFRTAIDPLALGQRMTITTVCPTPGCRDVHRTIVPDRNGATSYSVIETCPRCLDRGERRITEADIK